MLFIKLSNAFSLKRATSHYCLVILALLIASKIWQMAKTRDRLRDKISENVTQLPLFTCFQKLMCTWYVEEQWTAALWVNIFKALLSE